MLLSYTSIVLASLSWPMPHSGLQSSPWERMGSEPCRLSYPPRWLTPMLSRSGKQQQQKNNTEELSHQFDNVYICVWTNSCIPTCLEKQWLQVNHPYLSYWLNSCVGSRCYKHDKKGESSRQTTIAKTVISTITNREILQVYNNINFNQNALLVWPHSTLDTATRTISNRSREKSWPPTWKVFSVLYKRIQEVVRIDRLKETYLVSWILIRILLDDPTLTSFTPTRLISELFLIVLGKSSP